MNKRNLPNSLWAATAVAAPETYPLQQDLQVEVVIIGAGYTGLRAAIELRKANVNVAVIDAGDIGWGASGRSGGQVNPISHETPAVIQQQWQAKHGAEFAARFVDMTIKSADELFSLVREYDIQCDAEQNGWIRGLHSTRQQKQFEAMFTGWQQAGAKLRMIDASEVEQLSGARNYRMGWVADSAGSVQPLSYVRGLGRTAISLGAQVFTHTLATSIEPALGKWAVKTSGGNVNADNILLCTNAYADDLSPGLKQSLVPVIGIQSATAPLTDQQAEAILPGRHTFADTRRVIFYFKKTADNRLVFGSAGTQDELPDQTDRQRIMTGLKTVYPQFNDFKLDYIWGGRIAVTADHLPHIHQPAAGIYAALGCNGRGVAMSTVMGRLLAELALGKSPKELPIPVSDIKAYPFHRFHRIGVRLMVSWMEMRDKFEARY